MNIPKSYSRGLQGCMSPYPTVIMVVTLKYNAEIYWIYHPSSYTPYIVIHVCDWSVYKSLRMWNIHPNQCASTKIIMTSLMMPKKPYKEFPISSSFSIIVIIFFSFSARINLNTLTNFMNRMNFSMSRLSSFPDDINISKGNEATKSIPNQNFKYSMFALNLLL